MVFCESIAVGRTHVRGILGWQRGAAGSPVMPQEQLSSRERTVENTTFVSYGSMVSEIGLNGAIHIRWKSGANVVATDFVMRIKAIIPGMLLSKILCSAAVLAVGQPFQQRHLEGPQEVRPTDKR